VKIARGSLKAAIWRGDLPGYCARCHRKLAEYAIQHGHLCPVAGGAQRVVVRRREVQRYSASPTHQAAGRASARARRRRA